MLTAVCVPQKGSSRRVSQTYELSQCYWTFSSLWNLKTLTVWLTFPWHHHLQTRHGSSSGGLQKANPYRLLSWSIFSLTTPRATKGGERGVVNDPKRLAKIYKSVTKNRTFIDFNRVVRFQLASISLVIEISDSNWRLNPLNQFISDIDFFVDWLRLVYFG